jgi:dihydropteroate synthase
LIYYRPLVQQGVARPNGAQPLASGSLWFTHAEAIERDVPSRVVAARDIPDAALARLCAPRAPVVGLDMDQPQVMGILNVTPDSFSDGGLHDAPDAAIQAALDMVAAGATIIDIGGESTRPGATLIPEDQEIVRTAPVIKALLQSCQVLVSIDTRKSAVAQAALKAGAGLVNDVSGFTFDDALAQLCATAGVPVCIMHSKGDPATMQDDPAYDNVLLEVYDFLEDRIAVLERAGISRGQIIVDPGIGFGKSYAHNLKLVQNISLFHGLGCAILLGVSRKGFIGAIGGSPGDPVPAMDRAPGSIALGLAAVSQGAQILRVHDVAETVQALRLWCAARDGIHGT